jgi:hypothetical protein
MVVLGGSFIPAHSSTLYLLNRNYSDEVMRSAGWQSFRRNVQFVEESLRR